MYRHLRAIIADKAQGGNLIIPTIQKKLELHSVHCEPAICQNLDSNGLLTFFTKIHISSTTTGLESY